MSEQSPARLSAIDEERFGMRSARADKVTADHLPAVLDFCRDNAVTFLIARCPAGDLSTVQEMERNGFRLMDTLVYYTRNLLKTPIPDELRKVNIRPVRPGEEVAVRRAAIEAFRDYYGHYHADPRLDRAKCDEAYQSWAYRSCISKDVASEVLVAESNDEIMGFATLRRNSAEEGEGVLFGVAPKAQGRGIYWSFIVRGMEWCRDQGNTRMVVSTQITNLSVQKVWVRCGFEPSSAYYTFHKWFDEQ